MRPPYFIGAMLILVVLGAFQVKLSDPYALIPLVLLAAIWIGFFLSWLIPVLRDTASGELRVGPEKIELFGRQRHVAIDLTQCKAFALSKTRNEIAFEPLHTASAPCRFDHLQVSRQKLTELVDLLNELSAAARGEAVNVPLVETHPPVARETPPAHLSGPRLGPDGLLRYAGRTVYVVGATLLVSCIPFLLLAIMSVQCAEPVSATCAKIAPVVFAAFLLMIPIMPVMVYILRRYRGTAHRLRDLDEVPTKAAIWRAMIPFTATRNRLVSEYGTPGPNRFGPPPG